MFYPQLKRGVCVYNDKSNHSVSMKSVSFIFAVSSFSFVSDVYLILSQQTFIEHLMCGQ